MAFTHAQQRSSIGPQPAFDGAVPGKRTLTSQHVDRSSEPAATFEPDAGPYADQDPLLIAHDVDMFGPIDAEPEPGTPEPGESCDLPAPIDWSVIAAAPASFDEAWTDAPAFEESYLGDEHARFRGAFTASWERAQETYGALRAMHRAITPLTDFDASARVEARGAHVDATRSFEGGGLRAPLTAVDSGKAGEELRGQLLAKNDEIAAHDLTLADRVDDIASGVDAVQTAAGAIGSAADELEIVQIDAAIADAGIDAGEERRKLDAYKAEIKAGVEGVKLAADVVNCWSDPQKVFGNVISATKQGATAAGAQLEAMAIADANQELSKIDRTIIALMGRRTRLKMVKAKVDIDAREAAYRTAMRELQKKVRALQAAMLRRDQLHRERGELMGKVGAASGMSPAEQRALAGAVEALPKIEVILQQLTGMREAIAVPRYSTDAGLGAAMASNAGEFTTAVSVIKGTATYLNDQQTTWACRKATVLATIDRATAV